MTLVSILCFLIVLPVLSVELVRIDINGYSGSPYDCGCACVVARLALVGYGCVLFIDDVNPNCSPAVGTVTSNLHRKPGFEKLDKPTLWRPFTAVSVLPKQNDEADQSYASIHPQESHPGYRLCRHLRYQRQGCEPDYSPASGTHPSTTTKPLA